jgi:CRISPR-associated protein Csy3
MKLCNQLNYVRSLSPGKAVFFYKTRESDFIPLPIETNRITGQKSSFSEAYDGKSDLKNIAPQDLAYGNPQTIDACYVPPNIQEIYCRFSLRVEANSLEPMVCIDSKVRNWLIQLATHYKNSNGYSELARRYSMNILMGTWLWRNKQTSGTQIEVLTSAGNLYVIEDARRLSWHAPWSEKDEQSLLALTEEFSEALSNPKAYWFVEVTAKLKTSFCQEIFPSQRFTEKVERGESSKQLSTATCPDGQEAACFHAQKIGAALHLIDDWWGEEADKRLRVHEYGADKQYVIAQRHPSNHKDFYSLVIKAAVFIRHMKRHELDNNEMWRDIHYVMSVLLKGGLFQRGKN